MCFLPHCSHAAPLLPRCLRHNPVSMSPNEDPLALFGRWYEAATRAGIDKPNAMTLATVDSAGRPDARIVLLSSFDARGFVFHTNYRSRKGEQLAHNPAAALVFWWDPLGYQVRIDGSAEPTSPAESDAYFAQRPRASQVGAWASEQSREIDERAVLEARVRDIERAYDARAVPRPPHWGGYRVVPRTIEFWLNRDNRLHDRLRFARDVSGTWRAARLAP
jgi:pyridoxamine 5'-phosphate oxidase